MQKVNGFRLGNYAIFEGELQRIETQAGLDSSAFLDPLPISEETLKMLGFQASLVKPGYSVYIFRTSENDCIKVLFTSDAQILIMEQVSRIEYPFMKWIHQLQNLIEDKRLAAGLSAESRIF